MQPLIGSTQVHALIPSYNVKTLSSSSFLLLLKFSATQHSSGQFSFTGRGRYIKTSLNYLLHYLDTVLEASKLSLAESSLASLGYAFASTLTSVTFNLQIYALIFSSVPEGGRERLPPKGRNFEVKAKRQITKKKKRGRMRIVRKRDETQKVKVKGDKKEYKRKPESQMAQKFLAENMQSCFLK